MSPHVGLKGSPPDSIPNRLGHNAKPGTQPARERVVLGYVGGLAKHCRCRLQSRPPTHVGANGCFRLDPISKALGALLSAGGQSARLGLSATGGLPQPLLVMPMARHEVQDTPP